MGVSKLNALINGGGVAMYSRVGTNGASAGASYINPRWTTRRQVGKGTSRRTLSRGQRGGDTSRGVREESRRHEWWKSVTGVCVWSIGERWGQRAPRRIAGEKGPRQTGAGTAPRHAGVG